ncbi:MAG TPA: hypothetical protein VIU40_01000 [Geobacteraceae bacterium]
MLLALHVALLLAGCAPSRSVTIAPDFKPAPEQGIVYIAPFASTLVPETFSNTVFDTFVDDLNGNRDGTNVRWFYILKEDPKSLDPAWLAKQTYITGDIWGYVEEAGCCSAELRVKARARLFTPGRQEPAVEIFLPLETFVDFNLATLEAERQLLALRLADELAIQVLASLINRD